MNKKKSHQNQCCCVPLRNKKVQLVRMTRKLFFFLTSLSNGISTEWSTFSISFLLWKKDSFRPVTHGRQLVSCVVMTLPRESDFKEIRSKNKSAWQEYSGVARSYLSPCASDVSAYEDQRQHAIRRDTGKYFTITDATEVCSLHLGDLTTSKTYRFYSV